MEDTFLSRTEVSASASNDATSRASIRQQVKELETKLQQESNYITSLDFDKKKHGWVRLELQLPPTSDKVLLISIVERACRTAVVHEVKNISRILCPPETTTDPNADARLTVEGINLSGLWDFAFGGADVSIA